MRFKFFVKILLKLILIISKSYFQLQILNVEIANIQYSKCKFQVFANECDTIANDCNSIAFERDTDTRYKYAIQIQIQLQIKAIKLQMIATQLQIAMRSNCNWFLPNRSFVQNYRYKLLENKIKWFLVNCKWLQVNCRIFYLQ